MVDVAVRFHSPPVRRDIQARAIRGVTLAKIARLDSLACAMTNVKDFHYPVIFQDGIDHAIDARFLAIQKMAEAIAFGSNSTSMGMIFQREYFLFKPLIPAECCLGLCGVNVIKHSRQVALGTFRQPNAVSHTSF